MIDLKQGDSLSFYDKWPVPTMILSDGPYGVSGYDGDLTDQHGLAEFYEPHVAAWSAKSTPQTTLWFWNTEVGWAESHSVLKKHGWIYRCCNIWDKGMAHAAGNSNTKTLRKFPVVTEVCVHYVRQSIFKLHGSNLSAQEWLRGEWIRTKIPLNKSNEACGVKNAATRKYLTTDKMWYFPPSEIFKRLSDYANEHGDPEGRPYFGINGKILTGSQWEQLRGKFHCPVGITNVWNIPSLKGIERIKDKDGKSVHPNQKPLKIMEMLIKATTDADDWIWEPFGGLCSASVAANKLGRNAATAEIDENTFTYALQNLIRHSH